MLVILGALSLLWVKLSSLLRFFFDWVWSEDMGVIRLSCSLILIFMVVLVVFFFQSLLSSSWLCLMCCFLIVFDTSLSAFLWSHLRHHQHYHYQLTFGLAGLLLGWLAYFLNIYGSSPLSFLLSHLRYYQYHSEEYVHNIFNDIHTNNIERTWRPLKTHISHTKRNMKSDVLETYINAFLCIMNGNKGQFYSNFMHIMTTYLNEP